MVTFERSVPVLDVADVRRSIDWYSAVFGFESDPFPNAPPYSFAILRRDSTEIMLQCNESALRSRLMDSWSIYLRMSGGQLLEFAEAPRKHTEFARGPERMFYGQVEFEVVDPDGHVICVAEPLAEDADVPRAQER